MINNKTHDGEIRKFGERRSKEEKTKVGCFTSGIKGWCAWRGASKIGGYGAQVAHN